MLEQEKLETPIMPELTWSENIFCAILPLKQPLQIVWDSSVARERGQEGGGEQHGVKARPMRGAKGC